MSVPLNTYLNYQPRFARSANLERDAFASSALDGYVPTPRTLDVIERIARHVLASPSGGAWSITGPYGSGKSSLALMLAATFGPAGEDVNAVATKLLSETSPEIASLVQDARTHKNVTTDGFMVGLITANREPVSHTITRALHRAVITRFGKVPSKTVFPAAAVLRAAMKELELDDARRSGPSHSAVIEIATALADIAPLLLVIDEFGKNLEAVSDSPSAADPYLLQQLVEASAGEGAASIYTITMQHLSFEDYFTGHASTERREWAKVQGRFEDIPYVESASQTRALVETVYDIEPKLQPQVDKWAKKAATEMRRLDLGELAEPERLAASYPLHPITIAVLPELCSRYGQNERTLFSFLTGPEPSSVATFTSTHDVEPKGDLPVVELPQVYDYFVGSGSNVVRAGSTTANRWAEIATRVRDVSGITPGALKALKTIAVLNLVSAGGVLRASKQLLARILDTTALQELIDNGVITYRNHADEYRVWQGTNVDVNDLIDRAEATLNNTPTAKLLNTYATLEPAVAARHSAESDTLRVFERRWISAGDPTPPLEPLDPHDGIAYYLSDFSITEPKQTTDNAKPVVLATPGNGQALRAAALAVGAIAEVLQDPTVAEDWVARQEIGERLANAQTKLEHVIADSYDSADCQWWLATTKKPVALGGKGSGPLSHAADLAYPASVQVRSEMLNRSDLTSQSARARRQVITAMIEQGGIPGLGFEGWGPEVAMYKGLLESTGIHQEFKGLGWGFGSPISGDSTVDAWATIEDVFERAKTGRINIRDMFNTLASPPIGLKEGPIPILVVAGLLAHGNNIAIYEHGTFKPRLTVEISERLVKNPGHFEVKHFAANRGGRHDILAGLSSKLGIERGRGGISVLAVVGHIIRLTNSAPNYTRNTQTLNAKSQAVRDAIVAATEPDQLLFDTIPTAIGLAPVGVGFEHYDALDAYIKTVNNAVTEIVGAYDSMLDSRITLLLDLAAERSRGAVAGQAQALADEVLDPTIRAFALSLGAEVFDNDRDWIQNIATVVAKKAPAEWTDADRDRFDLELPQYIASFHRLVALHAEQRAADNVGFSALRVTVTRSDGAERARLITVDEDQREAATAAVENLVIDLRDQLGSEGVARQAIYAILSEQLLDEHVSSENETGREPVAKRKGSTDA